MISSSVLGCSIAESLIPRSCLKSVRHVTRAPLRTRVVVRRALYVRGRGEVDHLPELRLAVPAAHALRGGADRRGDRRPALLGLHDLDAGAADARGHGR